MREQVDLVVESTVVHFESVPLDSIKAAPGAKVSADHLPQNIAAEVPHSIAEIKFVRHRPSPFCPVFLFCLPVLGAFQPASRSPFPLKNDRILSSKPYMPSSFLIC
jgi:hypothetical protein